MKKIKKVKLCYKNPLNALWVTPLFLIAFIFCIPLFILLDFRLCCYSIWGFMLRDLTPAIKRYNKALKCWEWKKPKKSTKKRA